MWQTHYNQDNLSIYLTTPIHLNTLFRARSQSGTHCQQASFRPTMPLLWAFYIIHLVMFRHHRVEDCRSVAFWVRWFSSAPASLAQRSLVETSPLSHGSYHVICCPSWPRRYKSACRLLPGGFGVRLFQEMWCSKVSPFSFSMRAGSLSLNVLLNCCIFVSRRLVFCWTISCFMRSLEPLLGQHYPASS